MSSRVFGLLICVLPLLAAPAAAQTVSFLDANGAETASFLENTEARVRVTDSAADTSSSTWETVSVTLSTAIGGDFETLTLAETDRDSGVFEGAIPFPVGHPGHKRLGRHQPR